MKVALTATPSAARFAPIVFRGGAADAFAVASGLGYDGVELHLRKPTDVDRKQVARLIIETGVGVPTIGTGMAAGEDGLTFSDVAAAVRRKAVNIMLEHIELAAYLGSAVTVGLIRGRVGWGSDRETRWNYLLDGLREVSEAAYGKGVTVLLEPLNRYECDNITTLSECVDVISRLGAGNVKVLADTFHMNIEEADLAESLKLAGDRLGHVHLVDSNRRVPGMGHVDMRAVVEVLRSFGYGEYLSFECLPLPNGKTAIEAGIKYVKELL